MRFLLALLLCLGAAVASAQDKLESKAKLLSGANSVFTGMCKEQRENAKNATSVTTIRLADQSVELWCSCAPAEMERLVAGLSEPISKETALHTYTRATSICNGKQMRGSILAACPKTPDAIAKPGSIVAYCACLGSRLSAMTDEQLYADLDPAYNDEVLKNKERGRAPPFLEAFALRKYGAGCERATLSGNKENSVVGAK